MNKWGKEQQLKVQGQWKQWTSEETNNLWRHKDNENNEQEGKERQLKDNEDNEQEVKEQQIKERKNKNNNKTKMTSGVLKQDPNT